MAKKVVKKVGTSSNKVDDPKFIAAMKKLMAKGMPESMAKKVAMKQMKGSK